MRFCLTGSGKETPVRTRLPQHNTNEFRGFWSNYPWYEQGIVAVASQDGGLFVVKPRGKVGH